MNSLYQVRTQLQQALQQALEDYQTQVTPKVTRQRINDIDRLHALITDDSKPIWEMGDAVRRYVERMPTGWRNRSRLREQILSVLAQPCYRPLHWLDLQDRQMTHLRDALLRPQGDPYSQLAPEGATSMSEQDMAVLFPPPHSQVFKAQILAAVQLYRTGRRVSYRRAQDLAALEEAVSDENQATWIGIQAVSQIVKDIQTGWLGRSALRDGVRQVLIQPEFTWRALLVRQARDIQLLSNLSERYAANTVPTASQGDSSAAAVRHTWQRSSYARMSTDLSMSQSTLFSGRTTRFSVAEFDSPEQGQSAVPLVAASQDGECENDGWLEQTERSQRQAVQP
jgi:hypothetical protein